MSCSSTVTSPLQPQRLSASPPATICLNPSRANPHHHPHHHPHHPTPLTNHPSSPTSPNHTSEIASGLCLVGSVNTVNVYNPTLLITRSPNTSIRTEITLIYPTSPQPTTPTSHSSKPTGHHPLLQPWTPHNSTPISGVTISCARTVQQVHFYAAWRHKRVYLIKPVQKSQKSVYVTPSSVQSSPTTQP
jgi:hypothetical protein